MRQLLCLIPIALRNLGRNRRRTASTLAAIVVGIVGLILLDGYISYSMWGLGETVIHSGTGHFQVATSAAYFDDGDSDPFPYLIPRADSLAAELRRMPEVRDVVPSISFSAVVSLHGKMETVVVHALPSDRMADNLGFLSVTDGDLIGPDDHGKILVGEGLASKMELRTGDAVSLFAVGMDGGVANQGFDVAGLVSSGISAADGATIYMDLADAQALLGTNDVPVLIVFLDRSEDTDPVIARLAAHPPAGAAGLTFRSWKALSPFFIQANSAYAMVLAVARLIVMLVALFSISGTITLSVLERLREIGTLRAFGTRAGQVVALFLVEGLLLGVMGALVGDLLGAAVSGIVNAAGGIMMPAQPGMSHAIGILFRPPFASFVGDGVAVIVVALIGSLVPGIGAVRRTAAELLRTT